MINKKLATIWLFTAAISLSEYQKMVQGARLTTLIDQLNSQNIAETTNESETQKE